MFGIEGSKLNLCMVQRSMDVPLGAPYNIASYSLLLLLICRITGLAPGKFSHFSWNTHIYQDQMDGIIHQITRQPFPAPSIWIDEKIKTLEDLETWVTVDSFKMIGYQHHPKIVFPFSE
jgi:thymidylate synthase